MNCRLFITKPDGMIAGLLTGLLFAVLAVQLGAQTAPDSHAGLGFGPAYDAAHETIFNGTIQEVVVTRVPGSPAGTHLLVAGPQGVVDTSVGPFLSKETKETLQTGAPVRIVGATLSLNGKEYCAARELTVSGRTVTVRNEHGLLVHEISSRIARSKPEDKTNTSQAELAGDAR